MLRILRPSNAISNLISANYFDQTFTIAERICITNVAFLNLFCFVLFTAVREDRMPGGRNSGAVYNLYKVSGLRVVWGTLWGRGLGKLEH